MDQAALHQDDRSRASWADIRALFPPSARAALSNGLADPAPLFDEEAAAVMRAVAARQREFAHGRACARAALIDLGRAPAPIPVARDRSPVWPSGIVGSIAHCAGFVGAVVAPADELEAIGFDVEPAVPLAADLVPLICTPSEVEWMRTAPAAPAADWGTVLFSAKESLHKCIAPRSNVMLDFREVAVSVFPSQGAFSARPLVGGAPTLPRFERIVGRFVVTPAFVATAAFILASKKSGG